ncbi:hypothetical protein L2750_12885 [Shewanella submarina]|uniref:Uncharacterized protein n=1 Tax=Shewanella submarina TaxID=2016376 RepID=A0ABV7GI08_9GAMM|nr:hypothetical protein [Shewanella submarina]MCL1038045.1 hypothetical protein [Shewanella submarina]
MDWLAGAFGIGIFWSLVQLNRTAVRQRLELREMYHALDKRIMVLETKEGR